jgi:hypothetical protein
MFHGIIVFSLFEFFLGSRPRAKERTLTRSTTHVYSFLRLTQLPLQLIRGNHEPFNRLALNESIHNLRDVGHRDATVKKMIGFY